MQHKGVVLAVRYKCCSAHALPTCLDMELSVRFLAMTWCCQNPQQLTLQLGMSGGGGNTHTQAYTRPACDACSTMLC